MRVLCIDDHDADSSTKMSSLSGGNRFALEHM